MTASIHRPTQALLQRQSFSYFRWVGSRKNFPPCCNNITPAVPDYNSNTRRLSILRCRFIYINLLILYVFGGGAAQPTSGDCWLRRVAGMAPLKSLINLWAYPQICADGSSTASCTTWFRLYHMDQAVTKNNSKSWEVPFSKICIATSMKAWFSTSKLIGQACQCHHTSQTYSQKIRACCLLSEFFQAV